MKTKNIVYILMLALPMLLFTSCLKDQDDVFDENSANRMDEALANAKSVLRSAERGWVMDYYVGDDAEYGGYVYIVKFDSLTCTVMSELTGDTVSTSLYSMGKDDGPVLKFDSYNSVLHLLATPGPTTGSYEGYHADFEFIILSATSELVQLKGKKTGNIVTMRPLMTTPSDYLQKVKMMADSMIVASGTGTLDGKDVNADIDINSRTFQIAVGTDTLSCPFVYTDTGFRLYESLSVDGKNISEFSYDKGTNQITCTDSGTNLVLEGHLPSDYVDFADYAGNYDFIFQTSEGSAETEESISVTLTPSDDNTYYIMSGLSSAFDVVLEYNKSKGRLEMNTQKVATMDNGTELWFNAAEFSGEGGSLYVGVTSIGMVTTWNEDKENPVLTFSSNENEYLTVNSFCLWKMKDGSSEGQYTSEEYAFTGGRITLTFIKSLKKK